MKDNRFILYNILIIFTVLTSSCATLSRQKFQSVHIVTRVIDGDTFCIQDDSNKEIKIRLIGVDAPETRRTKNKEIGYYGEEAAQFLRELLLNKYIRLEFDIQKYDIYGRTLAYVYLEDTLINDYLVQLGYCKVATFPPNIRYQDLFIVSEKEARMKNRGLWSSD